MPALIPIVALSSVDATRLLRELSRRKAVPVANTPPALVRLLVQAGLARLDHERLVAVDQARTAEIIRAVVDEWLPDVLELDDRATELAGPAATFRSRGAR